MPEPFRPKYGTRIWHLQEDPELKLIHTSAQCPEARVAAKYNYLQAVSLAEGDIESARQLDARAKACPRCVRKEAYRRRSTRGHVSPPGFRQLVEDVEYQPRKRQSKRQDYRP